MPSLSVAYRSRSDLGSTFVCLMRSLRCRRTIFFFFLDRQFITRCAYRRTILSSTFTTYYWNRLLPFRCLRLCYRVRMHLCWIGLWIWDKDRYQCLILHCFHLLYSWLVIMKTRGEVFIVCDLTALLWWLLLAFLFRNPGNIVDLQFFEICVTSCCVLSYAVLFLRNGKMMILWPVYFFEVGRVFQMKFSEDSMLTFDYLYLWAMEKSS